MNPEKIICKCKHVTKGDVLAAIESGATTYKSVREMTGAGSKCAKCKDEVKSFIKKHKKQDTIQFSEQQEGSTGVKNDH